MRFTFPPAYRWRVSKTTSRGLNRSNVFLNALVVEKQRGMVLVDPGEVAHVRAEGFKVWHDHGCEIILRVLIQHAHGLALLVVRRERQAVG